MRSAIFFEGKRFEEEQWASEHEFEKLLVGQSKLLFGPNAIYIDAKKKIESRTLGGAIPDGFMFELSDPANPEFYLVEVELKKHDFYRHIFPQITKFFAFFKNPQSQSELIEKVFAILSEEDSLAREFKTRLGQKEIFKFIKDTIENSHNILLVLDDMKDELAEIMETYTDTWDKMVRPMVLKSYRRDGTRILSLTPDLENLELAEPVIEGDDESEERSIPRYSEAYHLDGASDMVKEAYRLIKEGILSYKAGLKFNPQKYYVSIVDRVNVAFIKTRRQRLNIVIMLDENETKGVVKSYRIRSLSEPVQKFYNGSCCEVVVDNIDKIAEVLKALKLAIEDRE